MKVLHLVEASAFNPILTDIARNSNSSRTQLFAGSLAAVGQMHEGLSTLGVTTFSLNCASRLQVPAAILECARIMRRHKIEVLHTHLVLPSFIGLCAARLARTQVRVTTRHHSDAVYLSGSRLARILDRLNGRMADKVIAVSEATKRAIMDIDHLPEDRIAVVPNGFDWQRITAAPDAWQKIRREFGIGKEFVVCTVGRLDKLKGHELLIKAFAKADIDPRSKLLVVGDGPLRTYLQSLINDLNLGDRCFLTGFRSDAYDLMAASDLMVHPSFSEAHSLTIIEAFSLGCPVLATDVGAAAEIVIPGKTGWLVPARDLRALAGAIKEASIDLTRARAYSQTGKALVASRYSIERMIGSYESIYEQLLRTAMD